MSNPKDFIDKYVAQRKQSVDAVKGLAHVALGEALAELLTNGEEPTRGNLIVNIQAKIADTAASKGAIAPELDYALATYQAALELLNLPAK